MAKLPHTNTNNSNLLEDASSNSEENFSDIFKRFNSEFLAKFNLFDSILQNIEENIKVEKKILTKEKSFTDYIVNISDSFQLLFNTKKKKIAAAAVTIVGFGSIVNVWQLLMPSAPIQEEDQTTPTITPIYTQPKERRKESPVDVPIRKKHHRTRIVTPPKNIEEIFTFVPGSGDKEHFLRLENSFRSDLIGLAMDYNEMTQGRDKLRINSAFRTFQEQKHLYMLWKTGRGSKAARPGHSKHERGLAVDIPSSQIRFLRKHNLLQRWGFSAGNVSGEGWHLERSDGYDDTVSSFTEKPSSESIFESQIERIEIASLEQPDSILKLNNIIHRESPTKRKRGTVVAPVVQKINAQKTKHIIADERVLLDESFYRMNSIAFIGDTSRTV